MVMFKWTLMALVLASALPTAAQDAAGCKDPAMFPTRIPNYVIASCRSANDTDTFTWPGGRQQVMGLRTEVVYRVPNAQQGAAPKYIAANYANAVKAIGGTLLLDPARTTLSDRVTARVPVQDKEVWVYLTSDSAVIGGVWQTYKLVTLAQDAAAQVVTAQKMLDGLTRDGFVTLYINFETGKADLKPDAQGTVGEIAALLKGQPALKLSIEGHTDNVGVPAANKTLSDGRARAVMDAVVKAGVAADRLKSTGHGQDKPVADNRTEEGRAKNRRVELVRW
jgi:outer membrane protein OmpA-like peptidoglycan-associated protein